MSKTRQVTAYVAISPGRWAAKLIRPDGRIEQYIEEETGCSTEALQIMATLEVLCRAFAVEGRCDLVLVIAGSVPRTMNEWFPEWERTGKIEQKSNAPLWIRLAAMGQQFSSLVYKVPEHAEENRLISEVKALARGSEKPVVPPGPAFYELCPRCGSKAPVYRGSGGHCYRCRSDFEPDRWTSPGQRGL